jgi:sucrose-6F-phosphate phosphohydrolase
LGGDWQTCPLDEVTSAGPHWRHACLVAPPGAAPRSPGAPAVEFVVTDGGELWDKAADGGNYALPALGSYRLQHGTVHAVARPPVLLVTDLDDSLIGDDEATAAFTAWWRAVGVPAGGRLVYNTGRALDLFEALLAEKRGVLAEPDMLISSVGTKIYTKIYTRRGAGWREDEAYAAALGRGWDLEAVREAAYAALAAVGRDAMHFRPPSEMNEHKVTCGVRGDVLDRVRAAVGGALDAAGVAHRLIVSGAGEWHYIDVVPARAGKAQALEYARAALGFDAAATVACGDSGNDVDMLQGAHHAVVVANAQPDLMEWARGRAAAAAGGGGGGAPLVTKAPRAEGILEALQQLGFRE